MIIAYVKNEFDLGVFYVVKREEKAILYYSYLSSVTFYYLIVYHYIVLVMLSRLFVCLYVFMFNPVYLIKYLFLNIYFMSLHTGNYVYFVYN